MISTSSSASDGRPPAATVGSLLHAAAERIGAGGSDTPRLDAEVLLGHVLGVDRATLLASPAAGVGPEHAQRFEALVERRSAGEPVSYLRGLKEFYGLAFTVDPRALIPRPETETLVDLALERLTARLTAAPRSPGTPALSVLDVGTGSGAIVISLAAEARRRRFGAEVALSASDTSEDALALAIENAVGHGVADVIDFAQADLATGRSGIDLLVANLPYIPSDVVPTLPVAASYEPRAALDGGPDGLAQIALLVEQLPAVLAADGVALLEIGADQADAVRALVSSRLGTGWTIEIQPDLGGRPRVAEIRRGAA